MIEAVVASSVVSLAILALAGLFILSLKVNAVAAEYTEATNLAQEKMAVLSAVDTGVLPFSTFADEEIALNNHIFCRRTAIVVRNDLDASGKIVQATVNVFWVDTGTSFHVSLLNYFINPAFSQYP